MRAYDHLLCISDIMETIMMPIERKCLTDGLVSPVVDVVANGALVLPPALVSTIGCAVTSDTAIVRPFAFARVVIPSASLVVFLHVG